MLNYNINPADGGLALEAQRVRGNPLFTIMSISELQESGNAIPCRNELLHSLGSIRYCKAETFRDCIIGTLRKKLEKEPNSPQYIQTHIGVGYRMMKVE